jgi:hypothetical protein
MTSKLQAFGKVHHEDVDNEQTKSKSETVYLHNCTITLENNDTISLPYARLEYYSYNVKLHKKTYTGKQHVFVQVTLWDRSTLAPNTTYIIKAINKNPINLIGITDEAGRLTARDNVEPLPQPPQQPQPPANEVIEPPSRADTIHNEVLYIM